VSKGGAALLLVISRRTVLHRPLPATTTIGVAPAADAAALPQQDTSDSIHACVTLQPAPGWYV
jgi:hypothetical protein